jgi:hypothetical protein
MLPKKEQNIYLKNDENLKSLISFYFDKYDLKQDKAIDYMKEKTSLSLNQFKFILKKLSEAYHPVFKKHLKSQLTIANLIQYGFDALTGVPLIGYRKFVADEFEKFVKETEEK